MNTHTTKEDGWTSIYTNGCKEPIVKVYDERIYSSIPFTEDMAYDVAVDIQRKILDELPTLRDTGSSIDVTSYTGIELIQFYWDEDDEWEYGIRNKKEAMKLARHFVKLWMMPELPTPKINSIEFKQNFGHTIVYKNGEKVAVFRHRIDAENFYKDDSVNLDGEINKYGLRSHSPKWDRSIRSSYFLNDKATLTQYCLLLVDYMDTWGRCD